MEPPKTIFCDIDGTLLTHFGNINENIHNDPVILNNVVETIHQWEKLNYKIILTTGRKECLRKITEEQLLKLGIVYDSLIMGITNGDRILINDKKVNGIKNTAFAINIVRNQGLQYVNVESKNITIDDKYLLLACVSKDFVKIEDTEKYSYYHFILENNGDDEQRFGVYANGILTETPSKTFFTNQKHILL